MKHVLTATQFNKEELLEIMQQAAEMEKVLKTGGNDIAKGKVLATLFYEPSTRTRFSSETAMLRLGGSVISNADMMSTSSSKKRESLWDTGKTVSQIADIIVVRHPSKGSVAQLAEGSDVPIINGGDGAGDHPTQGLLDLYTIWKHFDQLEGLTIGIVGDLLHSRVFHAQCQLLRHFGPKLILISPEELRLPDKIKSLLNESGIEYEETEDLAGNVAKLDVLSCNRIQEERFEDPEDFERLRKVFQVGTDLLKEAKEDMIILNPLPRVDELSKDVDDDPRAKYFEQVQNGVAVRMALIARALELL